MQSVALISCTAEKHLKEKHRKEILLTGADLAYPCDSLKIPCKPRLVASGRNSFQAKSRKQIKKKKKKVRLKTKPKAKKYQGT